MALLSDNCIEIKMCTFVSPYIFWITDAKQDEARKSVEKRLEQTYRNRLPPADDFAPGEEIVCKYKKTWVRGRILEDKGTCNRTYTCWLIDRGVMYDTTSVFKLEACFHGQPFAKQACLNKVVFMEQVMQFTSVSEEDNFKQTRVKAASAGTCNLIRELAANSKLYFFIEREVSNILFGDILFIKNGQLSSIRDTLVKKQIAVVDDGAFIKLIQKANLKDLTSIQHKIRLASILISQQNLEFNYAEECEDVNRTFRTKRGGISGTSATATAKPNTSCSDQDLNNATATAESNIMQKIKRKILRDSKETASQGETVVKEKTTSLTSNRSTSSGNSSAKPNDLVNLTGKQLMQRIKKKQRASFDKCTVDDHGDDGSEGKNTSCSASVTQVDTSVDSAESKLSGM